ncbi:MAG TPA: type II CAAX endopeptidase family protein [Anaerolineae bacterium]
MTGDRIPLSRLVGWICLLWAIANFGPYLLVYLLTGQPFYQALPVVIGGTVEVALLALNLGLPLWWLRRRGIPWREGLAWRWHGRRSWLWGMGGLAVVLVWCWLLARLLPLPETGAAEGQGYPLPQALLGLAGLMVLGLAAIIGEEAMFRGWMQTQLEAQGRIWLSVLLPALLFGLRHLPLDLYEGHAGLAAWAVRLLELYGLALVLGFIRWRSGSIAPAVILHGPLWWLVVFGVYGTVVGAGLGLVIGIAITCIALNKLRPLSNAPDPTFQ